MPFMPFQTRPCHNYVYDMNRNSIYKITEGQYEALCQFGSGSVETKVVAVLEAFQKKGLLLDSPVTKVQHPATEFLKYRLDRCVNSITFQMSQNCNLRCSYCPYSDNGIYDNRTHATKNMNWDTLQKGLDFLFRSSADVSDLNISFYGGEPLIGKELILRAINYAVNRMSGKQITFGMTTNGTLLDEEFVQRVEPYNISIMVSLDGPQKVHDKNRSFANGRGSYETLYRNVKRIKDKYPKVYHNLRFNTVIPPGSDYKEIFDFFRNNDEICHRSKVSFNTLSQNYTDQSFAYESGFFEERNYEMLKTYLLLLGKLKKEPLMYHQDDIETIFGYKEFFSPIKATPAVAHPSGTCVPGLKKLFVDVHGNFYPCERIDENSAFMRIGDVEGGFNVDKVEEIINIGAVTEENCKDCWAFHCCSLCPASTDNGKDDFYSKSYKLGKCDNVRSSALEKLKNYTMLREFKYPFDKEALLV